MDQEKWLEKVIDKIQSDLNEIKADFHSDLNEIKADLRILLEEKARNDGKTYVIVGIITVAINLLAAWLKVN